MSFYVIFRTSQIAISGRLRAVLVNQLRVLDTCQPSIFVTSLEFR